MNNRFCRFRRSISGTATALGLLLVSASSVTTAQDSPIPESIKHLPITKNLPDPLVSENGRKVKKPKQWTKRRAEILEMILTYEYGHVPAPPANPPTADEIESALTFDDTTSVHKYQLHFGPNKALSTPLHLYIPENGKTTHPLILRFGLGPEHARAANEHGYAFACFDQNTLDPDTEGHDIIGPAQALYPESDWASLAVWAWGASRILDYLDTRDDIDIAQSVITGHSRTGKAALLTGALDTRFAVVVPNGSGAGGSTTFRFARDGVETLELITRESRFKSWFHPDFGRFGHHVDRLPFDQHFMRALIAPRVVLSTDGYADTWTNPRGVQKAWQGAQPVFDLLGVPNHNLIHFREGGHDQLSPDFAVLLEVADAHFSGRPLPRKLLVPPFPKQGGK